MFAAVVGRCRCAGRAQGAFAHQPTNSRSTREGARRSGKATRVLANAWLYEMHQLAAVRSNVLDEADRILDMGFAPEFKTIIYFCLEPL